MNTYISNPHYKTSSTFLRIILLGVTLFCFFYAISGFSEGNFKKEIKNYHHPNHGRDSDDSESWDSKAVVYVIKYLANGEVIVTDDKNNTIAVLKNNFKPNGVLTELRNLTLITTEETGYIGDSEENIEPKPDKAEKTPLSLIANASTAPIIEKHRLYDDGDLVSCVIHRKSPRPHPIVGSCMK